MDEENFEPWNARTRSAGSPGATSFFRAAVETASRAGGSRRQYRRRFKGARNCRGSAVAHALMSPGRYAGFRSRSAVIKTRLVYILPTGLEATRVHLYYIQRGAVGRDGEAGRLYSAEEQQASGKEFLEHCRDDRHGFRCTLSVRDSPDYEDLEPLVRRFMGRMEQDLGTRLEWVAADHFNTSHPHTHLVLRGKDDLGENLVIAPDYIKHGMRLRLEELVSIDLGPRFDFENKRARRLEIYAERPTSIDRRLLEDTDQDRVVAARSQSMFEQAVRTGRLRKLETLGLASPIGGGRWRLDDELEARLRDLGERSKGLRILERNLSAAGIERAHVDRVVFQPVVGASVTGKIVARGFADQLGDDQYLIIDGVDGRGHYVEIGKGEVPGPLPEDAVVRVTAFAAVEHLNIEAGRVKVEVISTISLEKLRAYDGPTWLDRELVAPRDVPREAGFGRSVRSAMAARRVWLLNEGLASFDGEKTSYHANMFNVLEHREIARLAAEISKETGLEFLSPGEGRVVDRVIRKRFDLASGQFAMIDNGREFSLVPWQPEFDSRLGRRIGDMVRDGPVSWDIRRDVGLEP